MLAVSIVFHSHREIHATCRDCLQTQRGCSPPQHPRTQRQGLIFFSFRPSLRYCSAFFSPRSCPALSEWVFTWTLYLCSSSDTSRVILDRSHSSIVDIWMYVWMDGRAHRRTDGRQLLKLLSDTFELSLTLPVTRESFEYALIGRESIMCRGTASSSQSAATSKTKALLAGVFSWK